MNKIITIILFFITLSCFSQNRDGYQLMVTLENDSFVYFLGLPNKDEHYTGGAKVELFTPKIKAKWLPFLKLKKAEKYRNTFALSIAAFTPFDLSEGIKYGDRPYASYTALSFGKESYAEDSFLKSELYLGFLGLDYAGNAQSYMHKNEWFGTKRIIPKGWDNQIGYEEKNFTLNYAITYLKNLKSNKWGGVLAYRLDTNLGNYMLDFGAGLRFAYNLNNSPFLTGIIIKNQKKEIVKVKPIKKNLRLNVFFEPKLKGVLYNSTLQGALIKDKSIYKIPGSDIRRVQFEFNSGINIALCDFAYLDFTVNGRSQEFKGAKRFHYWGGVNIGARFGGK